MAAEKLNKVKTGTNAILFVVLVLAGLIALNLIFSRVNARKDFTADHIYTLSQASKDLVANLPDRMTVKAFISKDLQPPFSQTARYLRDLLDEYQHASKGKLVWEAIDPGTDPKLEEEATKMRVPKMRRGKISSNKVEIGANYLGVAFQYQGQIESIPEVSSPEGLEFQIDTNIKMMTVKKKKIGFAASEGELSFGGGDAMHGGGGGLQIIKQSLQDFDMVPVNLTQGDKPIADDVDALVIAGPKQPFSERAKFVIDQFLMKGKSVAFLVDGMVIEQPKQQMQVPGMDGGPRIGRKNDVQLDDLLEHYGLKIRDDVLMEPKLNVPGPVQIQGQMFLANFPSFIAVTKIDEKASMMDHIKAIVFPFASSVEPVAGKQPGATFEKMAQTSADSWRQAGFFLFDPQVQLKIGEDRGPFTVVWNVKGKLTSFFAGKPYPNEKGEKVPPPDPNSSLPPGVDKPLNESTGSPRLVVIGDSEFASDEYLRFGRTIPTYQANLLFFMNLMGYLAQDEALAPIRAKGVQSRPLTFEKESTPTVVQYANIIGVPLLFIVYGVIRWRLRTARRRNAKL